MLKKKKSRSDFFAGYCTYLILLPTYYKCPTWRNLATKKIMSPPETEHGSSSLLVEYSTSVPF
jgi:hypothetical protein